MSLTDISEIPSFPEYSSPAPANVTSVFTSPLNQSLDRETLLQAVNDKKAMTLLPAILFTVLLLMMGLLGNPLAMYIYGWRWQSSSTKIFLFCLSVIDLLNCLITIPTEITSMRNYYDFPSDGLCKVSRFTTYAMNNTTVVIFLSIAVDRYLRICHPHRSAVSARSAKLACGIGILLGIVVSWPALFLYGRIEMQIPVKRNPLVLAPGGMCLVHRQMETYSLAFFIYLWSAFFICVLILVILYTLMGRAILKRKRMLRRRKEATAAALEKFGGVSTAAAAATDSVTATAGLTPQNGSPNSNHDGSGAAGSCRVPQGGVSRVLRQDTVDENLQGCHMQQFSFHCKKLRPPKATLMLFLITVVFITSFLPFLIITIIRHHRGPALYLGLSSREQVIVNIFIRSYIVNNCTNPIVYGLCNAQFREECRRLFLRLSRCRGGFGTLRTSSSAKNSDVNPRSRTLYETPRLTRKVSPEP